MTNKDNKPSFQAAALKEIKDRWDPNIDPKWLAELIERWYQKGRNGE